MGFVIPVNNIEEAKKEIQNLRNLHPKAVHVCFAWRIGLANYEDRFSDDGEPNNSAGKPIFGQIINAEITNILVAVVRYYGGTKLGVGGLISAYKTAAKEAILAGKIIQKHQEHLIKLSFEAAQTGEAMMHINRSNAIILEHSVDEKGHYVIFRIRTAFSQQLLDNINNSGKFTAEIIQ